MRRFRHAFVVVFAPALLLSTVHTTALAQGSEHTWSGITGPEDVTFDGSDPSPGHSWMWHEAISGDGHFVTFWSSKTKLVADDTNGVDDAFVRDRVTQQTEIVSIASDG